MTQKDAEKLNITILGKKMEILPEVNQCDIVNINDIKLDTKITDRNIKDCR